MKRFTNLYICLFLIIAFVIPNRVSSGWVCEDTYDTSAWKCVYGQCQSYLLTCTGAYGCSDDTGCSYDECTSHCRSGHSSNCIDGTVTGGCNVYCEPDCTTCTITQTCAEANGGDTSYTTTYDVCQGNPRTCSISNGCDGTCNNSQPCYRPEPNTKPLPPSAPRITIDGYTYGLSMSENNWTRVRKPLPNQPESAVRFSVSPQNPPAGTYRNPLFDFTAENLGVANEWQDEWENCTGVVGEDFCNHNRNLNYTEFHGDFVGHKTPLEILKEGAQGMISFRYHTKDVCTEARKYSDWRIARYKVNKLPKIPDPIINNVVITGNPTTQKNCTANNKYTGLEANNPLTITVKGYDPDGASDINGLSLWLVKKGVGDLSDDLNRIMPMGSGATRTNPNEIGMFFPFLNGGITHLYKANNENGFEGWGRDAPSSNQLGTSKVQSSQGLIIESATATYTKIGLTAEVVITLKFPNPATPASITGEYDIYVGFSDIFTFSQKTQEDGGGVYLDSQNIRASGKSWNFDFRNPRLTAINLDRLATGDQKNLKLSWTSTDSGHPESEVVHTVINVSSSSDKEVTRTFPDPENPVSIIPGNLSEAEMGNLSPLRHGWKHPVNSNGFETYMIANTGDTASGTLRFDVTLYDRACNFGGTGRQDQNPDPDEPPFPDDPDPFDYNRWMSTKGGIFYSQGTVDYRTKLLEPNIHFYNLGSELLATKANGIDPIREVLMFGGTEQHRNPAVAKGVEDTNEQNKVNLYEALKREANSSMDKKLSDKIISSATHWHCSSDKGCYIKSDKDLTIGSFRYTGKILIYSQGNITITGALQATSNNDAIFVFSEKNIIVNDGHATGGTDRIDAFLLAKERITIAQDAAVSENHDQVLLVGGLIAFGIGGESPSFVLQRNLGADNPLRPALIINYHPKYTKFAENFFDVDRSVYKKEVGFKPL